MLLNNETRGKQEFAIESPEDSRREIEFHFLFWSLSVVAVVSLIFTKDRVNWFLDAGWVAAGLPLIYLTRRVFPLSRLVLWLLVFHALVLISGGFWTYEKMPLGVWVQETLGAERNHYDRFGHFLQGFVPAIVLREIFLRCSPLTSGGWLSYFVISSCLAFSACFEFLEWWAVVLSGASADEFLGHQGDVWDAQWDMLCALVGAVCAVVFLSKLHDRLLGNRQLTSRAQH